jgi:ribosomal protein S18 acetylase RimI-like enzyme
MFLVFMRNLSLPIAIRPAAPADISQILPMVAKICELHRNWDTAKYGFLPNPERRYDGWIQKVITSKRDLWLVAEAQSLNQKPSTHLVGFLAATVEREVPIYEVKEYAFIHDLWVEPDYRRAGVGRQLMQQAIAHFTEINVPQIRLDTAAINESARQLFASLGFRISTIEMLMETTSIPD